MKCPNCGAECYPIFDNDHWDWCCSNCELMGCTMREPIFWRWEKVDPYQIIPFKKVEG